MINIRHLATLVINPLTLISLFLLIFISGCSTVGPTAGLIQQLNTYSNAHLCHDLGKSPDGYVAYFEKDILKERKAPECSSYDFNAAYALEEDSKIINTVNYKSFSGEPDMDSCKKDIIKFRERVAYLKSKNYDKNAAKQSRMFIAKLKFCKSFNASHRDDILLAAELNEKVGNTEFSTYHYKLGNEL
jgi:hypothetical protein